MARRYLLSIDGGGIRGIIPAIALAKLESTTGRRTRETFSLVAGTSTGAIIAAAVAAGVPADRIRQLYVERSSEILTRRPWNLLKRIFSGSMYSTRKLHDVVAEAMGPARDWELNDSPVDLLLTAKQVPAGTPWYFVRDNPKNSGCTGRLGLVDCATASAAAPTYFSPWELRQPPGLPPHCVRIGPLIDGGVGVVGNPVYQACVEAFDYNDGYLAEETTTVSLGTGRHVPTRRPSWILSWLRWVLGELLESPGEQQTEITRRHFPSMSFYRIDCELEENIPLDDVRNVGRLVEYGERLAERIDWKAILEGTDTVFRIDAQNTLWEQYRQSLHRSS